MKSFVALWLLLLVSLRVFGQSSPWSEQEFYLELLSERDMSEVIGGLSAKERRELNKMLRELDYQLEEDYRDYLQWVVDKEKRDSK